MNVSSLFSSLMQAFDAASQAERMRQMEQSQRLMQSRRTQEAQASTVAARVEVHSDGFQVLKSQPVSLGQVETNQKLTPTNANEKIPGQFRSSEVVDGVAAAIAAAAQLNQK